MKLHWSPRSPFVRKVMIAAHELGLVDRLQLIRTTVAMSQPNAALLPDNPLSKIPTLILDDGTALYDSVVIIEYLEHLAGKRHLFPVEPAARFLAHRRHALGNGFLDLLILWRNERDRPEQYRSPPHLAAHAVKAEATLAMLEREADAIAATPFGIGHIGIGCALSYMDFRFVADDWRKPHPHLAAWHATFGARPSHKATEPYDG